MEVKGSGTRYDPRLSRPIYAQYYTIIYLHK
jgi:hypothetical protein